MEFVLRALSPAQDKQQFIQMWLAYTHISMFLRVRVDPQKVAGLELAHVGRQSTVGDPQRLGKVIHAHPSVLYKKVQDINPGF